VGNSGILTIQIHVSRLEAKTMFRGINGVNIDVKGRLAMPTRYRDHFQIESRGTIVLTIDTDEKCLLLYPVAAWEEIETKLAALPSFNPAARRIQRLLIGHATEVEMDSNGRILLPPILRDYAGLSKQVMLVGQGKKFEVWSDTHWEERRTKWLTEEFNPETDFPEELKLLSL
jgi:MraZ protein